MNIAAILWAFEISAPLGSDGTPIIPSRTDCIDEGIVVYVKFLLH